MRPSKPINTGAHRSGTAERKGKGRHYVTRLPTPPPAAAEPAPELPAAGYESESKYVGRASVGRRAGQEEWAARDLAHAEWVDPLDQDEVDLTEITIDLRPTMIDDPSDTYYQRFSSRVPGRQ